jgi:hypothetical protein
MMVAASRDRRRVDIQLSDVNVPPVSLRIATGTPLAAVHRDTIRFSVNE